MHNNNTGWDTHQQQKRRDYTTTTNERSCASTTQVGIDNNKKGGISQQHQQRLGYTTTGKVSAHNKKRQGFKITTKARSSKTLNCITRRKVNVYNNNYICIA